MIAKFSIVGFYSLTKIARLAYVYFMSGMIINSINMEHTYVV